MTGPIKGERQVPLEIIATRTETGGEAPPLTALAFSSGGALLDRQRVDEKGNARLSLPLTQSGDMIRVLLTPIGDDEKVDVGELLRRGGIDAHVALRPGTEKLPPLRFELTPDILGPLLGRRCLVKGTLLKRVLSGGLSRDLPVCNAAVDIWEVDPWPFILPRLPDLEIDRLRPILVGPWPPIELPIPPRPVDFFADDIFPDLAGPVTLNPQPLPPRSSVLERVGLNPQPLPPREVRFSGVERNPQFEPGALSRGSIRGFNPQPDPPGSPLRTMVTRTLPSSPLPADLQLASRSSRATLERAVVANIELLRPILCWLYPQRVRKVRIATAMTDECGHFRTTIWRSFLDADVPDLYFTARQRIWPGFWVTIYEPTPVSCHTHWNYRCGTEVTLITRHRAARSCPPCPPIIAPNNWVLFMAIGNTSVWRIHGANTSTASGSPGFDATKHGLLDGTAPWGGTLRPRLEFDNALRSTLGVHYYRVSYKRPTEPETEWRFSIEAINRHFVQTIAGEPVITQYPLGPVTVGPSSHLYEIPPALPPIGQWSLPNVVLDTQSAVIDTRAVAPGVGYDASDAPSGADQGGLWQIRVELFTASGAAADPEALGIAWRVPESADLTGTIDTANAATLGLVDAARNCLIVTVFVDNNPCRASIGAPTVNGNPASAGCGVMNYSLLSATVATPFTALQRTGFADYAFYVQRGEGPGAQIAASGQAATTLGGMPAAPTSTVGDLLDGCTIAGFTEQLYVAHRATDGWSRQVQNDASAVRAFVLAPSTPAPTP